MTKLLAVEALDAWMERWRALGVPYLDAWRPGLTDEQINAVTAEHGVKLAPELRTWWQWRDGTRRVSFAGRSGPPMVTVSTSRPWSLETALQETAHMRELMDEEHRLHPGSLLTSWVEDERWLAIGDLGHGAMIYADLHPSPHGGSEIRRSEYDSLYELPPATVPIAGDAHRVVDARPGQGHPRLGRSNRPVDGRAGTPA